MWGRAFAHLAIGDSGRGSTDVHEFGRNPVWRTPLRRSVLPTLTLVEDTLETAPERVLQVLDDAREYARRFLNTPGEAP